MEIPNAAQIPYATPIDIPFFNERDSIKYALTTPITAIQDGRSFVKPFDCRVAIAPINSAIIAQSRKKYFIVYMYIVLYKDILVSNGMKYVLKESYR